MVAMTVWMDFNPMNYFKVSRFVPVGDGVVFCLVWVGIGSLFEVTLRFEGCRIVLFRHLYPLGGMCTLDWDEAHEHKRMRQS